MCLNYGNLSCHTFLSLVIEATIKHFTRATICLQWAPISCPASITVCESFHPYNTQGELFYTLIYPKKFHPYCHITLPGFKHLFIHHQASPIPSCKHSLPWEARCCFLWYLQASNNTLVSSLLPIPTPFTIPEWDIPTSDKRHFP